MGRWGELSIRMRGQSLLLATCAMCLLLHLAACDYVAPLLKSAPTSQPVPIEATFDQDTTHVVVRASKSSILVAEPLNVVIEVQTEKGVDVAFPEAPDTLGPFTVRASKTHASVPIEGGRSWSQTYELETYHGGTATFPPIELTLTDKTSAKLAVDSQLATPELTIEVKSSLPANADPTQVDDIKGVVSLPGEVSNSGLYLLIGFILLVVLAFVVAILWRRHKRKLIEARMVPPHERALQRLIALRADMPTSDAAVQAFYYALTGIVREYIEDRFDIRAVEQTTREFIEAARRHPALSNPAYSGLLAGFLIAGDLVKFARHLPESDEIEQALQAAETFVRETTPAEPEQTEEVPQ